MKPKNKDLEIVDGYVAIYKNSIDPVEKREALTKLVAAFDTYFWKYVHILRGEKVELFNRDTFGFYVLFLAGKEKNTASMLLVQNLIRQIGAKYEPNDLYNTFVMLFVSEVLNKYKIMKGINFTNYATKVFRYRLKDWCTKISKDPLCRVTLFDDMVEEPSTDDYSIDYQLPPDELDLDIDLAWDANWIAGAKNPLYSDLTPYERYLLYLTYAEDLSIQEISKRLLQHKDTIWRHIVEIRKKIKDKVDERNR